MLPPARKAPWTPPCLDPLPAGLPPVLRLRIRVSHLVKREHGHAIEVQLHPLTAGTEELRPLLLTTHGESLAPEDLHLLELHRHGVHGLHPSVLLHRFAQWRRRPTPRSPLQGGLACDGGPGYELLLWRLKRRPGGRGCRDGHEARATGTQLRRRLEGARREVARRAGGRRRICAPHLLIVHRNRLRGTLSFGDSGSLSLELRSLINCPLKMELGDLLP
mmetsp:Transcript_30438/g.64754  ORF Transcript_30438/g.64754 Transcript_30438/m.64754 type:complete len:219 (+) Transcript_30438:109-765(+)